MTITIERYVSDRFRDFDFEGFFVGWPRSPGAEGLVRVLDGSYRSYVAVDLEAQKVVGFVNCVSDGVLSCYIPLLEVLPPYRSQGIATRLVESLLKSLDDFYMIDLVCDDSLTGFYAERFGMRRLNGMALRNYGAQTGRSRPPSLETTSAESPDRA